MISSGTIGKIIRILTQAARPEKLYLFGSYARGDA
ncbi:MAG: nucleotidyltransferase domain-containing protein [Candidatus Omnitrophota bacterium]